MAETLNIEAPEGLTANGQGPTPKGQGATGPKTQEGKRACRLNAWRHGLTGQIIVLTPDEQQAYENHTRIVLDALAPATDFERIIAQSIADGHWRLNRARAIESSMFALGMQSGFDDTGDPQVDEAFDQAHTWIDEARNLNLLTIYEQRIQRSVDKNTAQLKAIQAERKEQAQEAMRQAKLLYQLAEAEGKPYQPEAYFTAAPEVRESVFSTTEIVRELTRTKLLNDADYYVRTGSLPPTNPSEQPVDASRNLAPPPPAARQSAVTV